MSIRSHAVFCALGAALFLTTPASWAAGSAAKPAATKIDSYWQATNKAFPEGAAYKKPMAWAAGQYVVVGRTSGGKRTTVTKTLIVRKEGDGWLLETTNIDAKGATTVVQVLLAGYDAALASGDASKLAITRMTMRDKDGKVTVMEKEQLAAFGDLMKQGYQKMLGADLALKEGGAVTVPAGSFAATKSAQSTVTMFGVTSQVQNWYNAAVPINGVVKSASLDGKELSELLAFGFDGKSSFN